MTRVKEVDPDSNEMPDYKSPSSRLVHSLRKGYDNLRSKLKKSRDDIKYYQIKTRDLNKSRTTYKDETLSLKKTIDQLEKENKKLKKLLEGEEIKKKAEKSIIPPESSPKAHGYSYNIQQMLLTIQCAIQGSAGFRCVSRIFEIVHNALSLPSFPTPVFSTIRDWLLKLGLFNLTKPCEPGRWVWIIDFSIQMGAMRCLLILGVRMEVLEARGDFTLSHSDVEPIILKTLESCPGEVVKEALDEARSRTGEVIAIVSDQGGELRRGIRLFQEEQKEKPVHLYDIMHKVDLVLKKELESDNEWQKFIKEMTNTTQQLKQTVSSHLIPPKQYQKKRRMRSEVGIIEWGVKALNYLNSEKASKLEKEKLSWIIKYKNQLIIYQEMAIFFDMSTKEVRERGYCQKTVNSLRERTDLISCNERSLHFFSKILEMIEQEVNKVPQGSLLGCSEVI